MPEEQITAIKCGRLIDGTGAEPLENTLLIIEGSKIKAIGKSETIPEGVNIIDATGKTVMPGLIDAHVHHVGLVNQAVVLDIVTRPMELSLIKSVFDSKKLLAAGFTTARDCGGMNGVFLKKAVAEGTLTGLPRIVAAAYVLIPTGGHEDAYFYPPECVDARTSKHKGPIPYSLICDGGDECLKATRYTMRCGADFIKVVTSGGVAGEGGKPTDLNFNPDEIKAIVDAAAQKGKFVAAHSQNSQASKNAILGGIKTIEHANETSGEVIDLAIEHGAVFVSTLAIAKDFVDNGAKIAGPKSAKLAEREWAVMCDSLRRINKAGAKLACGTDGGVTQTLPLGKNAMELELLVKYCDFSPMDAILAATKHGAMACFMGEETGTLEVGKFADIIVVDGNPLDDIRILQDLEKIKMVLLEGKVEIDRGLK